jgi:hypothetical protein
VQHVNVAAAQTADLTEAQTAKRAEYHHRPALRFDGVGNLEHLRNRPASIAVGTVDQTGTSKASGTH